MNLSGAAAISTRSNGNNGGAETRPSVWLHLPRRTGQVVFQQVAGVRAGRTEPLTRQPPEPTGRQDASPADPPCRHRPRPSDFSGGLQVPPSSPRDPRGTSLGVWLLTNEPIPRRAAAHRPRGWAGWGRRTALGDARQDGARGAAGRGPSPRKSSEGREVSPGLELCRPALESSVGRVALRDGKCPYDAKRVLRTAGSGLSARPGGRESGLRGSRVDRTHSRPAGPAARMARDRPATWL